MIAAAIFIRLTPLPPIAEDTPTRDTGHASVWKHPQLILGVIALFGSDALKTLPYLLLERMGSYRTADAAGLALIIASVCLGLMMLADYFAKERT